MFGRGRRMKLGSYVARRRSGRRAVPERRAFSASFGSGPFMPPATGVEEFFEEEEIAPFIGPTRAGEQVGLFGEEEIAPGGALMPTALDRPVLNRKQFIGRYQSELKMAYKAACARLRAMGRDCPNYATLAKVAHDIYREHREAGSSRPVLWIIYDASQAVWQGDAPMMLRRMEKTFQQFSKDYKDLINLARQDGNKPAFSTAASAGFAAYKAEPDRRKALEAARIAILELPRSARRRKKPVATKKKKPTARKPAAKKPMNKTQRAAMRKPPGASCPSAVGRKAAEQQFTIGPTKLKAEITTDSKDVLLYRLQAEMSKAGKRRPRVVAMLKRALAEKGLEKLPKKFDKKPSKAKGKPKGKPKAKAKAKAKAKPKTKRKSRAAKPAATLTHPLKGKASVAARAKWIKKNKATITSARTKAAKSTGKKLNWVSAAHVAYVKCSTLTAAQCKAEIPKVILAGAKSGKVKLIGKRKSKARARPTTRRATGTTKPKAKAKAKAKPKAKPKKKAPARAAAKGKSKPHKAAEAKAKRVKGKIKTDEKKLKQARAAVAKAPTAKKPAKRKARDKVASKLSKDKKELAAAKKSVTLHASKAASKPKKARKRSAPTTRRSSTTRKTGKSTFRVKGNITVSA